MHFAPHAKHKRNNEETTEKKIKVYNKEKTDFLKQTCLPLCTNCPSFPFAPHLGYLVVEARLKNAEPHHHQNKTTHIITGLSKTASLETHKWIITLSPISTIRKLTKDRDLFIHKELCFD
ncbi:unnamed protein product [Clavelina lepadiformis]|uniref:Uncharacterized protein n=1 Tax=Clavelina lepadiformis TaxID=159417 RepID=A0ABP0H3H8_CLALP